MLIERLMLPLLLVSLVTAVQADDAWLFTSFRGSGDGLHLAYSTDARNWTDTGKVWLRPTVGSKLMRDPHIERGPDGRFHLVWTSGWGDMGIGYASSDNLVDWSEQRYIPLMEDTPGTTTCWAPEAFYDDQSQQFILMWSSNVEPPGEPKQPGGHHRCYYVLTKDWDSFTKPKMLHDPGVNNIDTTMLKHGDRYLIVYKETDDQPAGIWGRVLAAVAPQPLGPYRQLDRPVVEGERVEGPALLQTADRTLVYADYYVNHRYGAWASRDLGRWRNISRRVNAVEGQRHGSILKVSTQELARVAPAAGQAPPPAVLPGVNADPHIAAFNGRFYLYPTTDGTTGWRSTSFQAWSSEDLVDWRNEGVILDLPRDLAWADLHAWAPACATKDGKYYYYYSADKNIGVAVADQPGGPFSDPLGRPLVSSDRFRGMQAIDPMVFVDTDGAAYLYWGQGRCKAVRLNDDMISYDASQIKDITPPGYNEGPHVHRRNDTYYLTWSEYDTRDPRYSVAYGTSDSPLGPFKKADQNPILKQRGVVKGAGHHSLTRVPGTDQWVIAYHRFRIPGGNGYNRETCLSPLEHDAQGRIKPVNVYHGVRLEDGRLVTVKPEDRATPE